MAAGRQPHLPLTQVVGAEPADLLELAVAHLGLAAVGQLASKPSISDAGNGHGCEET